MSMTVTMPQLGESVTEGTIARWLKQPGEAVAKYESIAEVVTDKVNAEIPAPVEGTMGEHIAEEGAVVAVGQPICSIDAAGAAAGPPADASAPAPAEPPAPAPAAAADPVAPTSAADGGTAPGTPVEQPAPAPPPATAAAAGSAPAPVDVAAGNGGVDGAAVARGDEPPAAAAGEARTDGVATASPGSATGDGGSGSGSGTADFHLTPAVRMLIREHDVDLSQVRGTGLGGRISKKDVLDFVQRRDAGAGAARPAAGLPAPAPAAAPSSAPAGAAASAAAPAPAAVGTPAAPARAPQPQAGGGDEIIPLTPTRRAIAEHMVRSKHTSPHAWLSMEVDMSRVAALRGSRRAEFEQHYGVKLTYLPFVARAVCEALRRYPSLNASYSDDGIIMRHDIHLGIAVALEDNLIVPVVRNADRLSIAGLAATMQDLGDRARSNKLKLDEIQGGTFTLNNTGALGTVHTAPIINQPQAAILSMDAVIKRAVVVDDAIAIRPMMNLGLSFDHRLNDGLAATRFTKMVKEILESIDAGAALL